MGAARNAAESLRLFRQAGDRLGVGQMLGRNLGYYELSAGDLDAARRHLAESHDIARPLNDWYSIVHTTFNLGLAEYLGGLPDAAGALFAESLDLARRTGMRAMMAYALIGLALRPRPDRPGLVGPAARRGRPGPRGSGPRPPAAGRTAGRRGPPAVARRDGDRGLRDRNTPRAARSTWRVRLTRPSKDYRRGARRDSRVHR